MFPRGLALALLAGLLLAGCAGRGPLLDARRDGAGLTLTDIPFFPQRQYHCGPAALATVLVASGVPVAPDELVPLVYLPARRGSLQAELMATARGYGRLPYPIGPSLDELLAELGASRPVLVLQNLGLESVPIWHYAVVIGFDPAQDRLILHSGVTERLRMSAQRFLNTWRRAGAWGLVMLAPGELPARPDPDRYLRAAAALESTGRVAAAERAYRAVLEHWDDRPLARFGLANSRHAQGDYRQAEVLYRSLLARRPEHVPARHNLARTLAARGCYAAALEQLDIGQASAAPALGATFRRTRAELLELAGRGPGAGEACV
ncbi:MAG: PA2778 family cysteine peptidase, partial [Candidatus Competibacterales bacterium]|nr:PA2778 family cysteine peptidase [Candidatus Competibacterales bacterium]